jgi:hypothetical protein
MSFSWSTLEGVHREGSVLVKKVGGRRKVVVVWEVDGGGGGSRVAWNRKKKLSSKIRHTDQNHTVATHPTCHVTSSSNVTSHVIHSATPSENPRSFRRLKVPDDLTTIAPSGDVTTGI